LPGGLRSYPAGWSRWPAGQRSLARRRCSGPDTSPSRLPHQGSRPCSAYHWTDMRRR